MTKQQADGVSEAIMGLFNRNRFRINRFRDGDNIGLPRWAKHLVIGGFGDQGWNAYDQRQGGKLVATGEWGDYLERAALLTSPTQGCGS